MFKKLWLMIVLGVTFTPAVFAGGEMTLDQISESSPDAIGCNLPDKNLGSTVTSSSSSSSGDDVATGGQ
jgi:hypothetical protein